MAYKTFEESLVWQKAEELVVALHRILEKSKEPWLKNELLTRANSAANYVALSQESYEDEQRMRYLLLAKEEWITCRSMLAIASKLRLLSATELSELNEKATDASKVTMGLFKYLRNRPAKVA